MASIKWGKKTIQVPEGKTPKEVFESLKKTNPELKLTTMEEKDGEFRIKEISYGRKG